MNFCWKRYKLLGIGGNLLKPIASYLTNRAQSVKIDDLMSTLQNYLMASPRGLLGPFRFLLYVNDLPEPKTYAHSYGFADEYKAVIHCQQGLHDTTAAL